MSTQPIELPAVVATYQAAHDGHDVDAALSTFTQNAVVHDEDQDWVGPEQIRQWLVKTSTEYIFTRTLLGVEFSGTDSWLVRNRLEGNFPGAWWNCGTSSPSRAGSSRDCRSPPSVGLATC